MIRQTIAATKSATWAVGLHVRGQGLVPTGSGFFVGEGGLFATAAHVIEQHEPVQVIKERRGKEDSASLDVAEVAFCDQDADFALLKIATIPTRCSEVLPASLRIAARELEEGEPVYAYGYPLTVVGTPVHFSEEHLREWGIPLELIIGPDGRNLAEMGGLPEGFRALLLLLWVR
jgi:S1-C subfamily serine protease